MQIIGESINLKEPATFQTKSKECPFGCQEGWQVKITPEHPQGIARRCACLVKKIEQQKYENLLRAADCLDYQHMTLESYIPQTESQKKALQTIQTRHGSYFLKGPWGTGKTHLMAGTILRAIDNGIQSVLISVPELLRQMRKAGRDDKASIEDLAQDIPYLCLDDLGKQKDSDWTEERLFALLDARSKSWHTGQTHTSVTSNFTLKALSERMDGAIIDRIKGITEQILVDGESYRGKK